MAGLTLAQAQAQLDAVATAITDILTTGISSYSIGNRSATRHDLATLLDLQKYLNVEVARLSAGGRTIKGATPC